MTGPSSGRRRWRKGRAAESEKGVLVGLGCEVLSGNWMSRMFRCSAPSSEFTIGITKLFFSC